MSQIIQKIKTSQHDQLHIVNFLPLSYIPYWMTILTFASCTVIKWLQWRVPKDPVRTMSPPRRVRQSWRYLTPTVQRGVLKGSADYLLQLIEVNIGSAVLSSAWYHRGHGAIHQLHGDWWTPSTVLILFDITEHKAIECLAFRY